MRTQPVILSVYVGAGSQARDEKLSKFPGDRFSTGQRFGIVAKVPTWCGCQNFKLSPVEYNGARASSLCRPITAATSSKSSAVSAFQLYIQLSIWRGPWYASTTYGLCERFPPRHLSRCQVRSVNLAAISKRSRFPRQKSTRRNDKVTADEW